jgi:glutathione S-transferase
MPAGATDLIVHCYNDAPAFSQKARAMLGVKNAHWFASDHPTILPKPDLSALTGGYRQIPVAQIGADVFCGSELILDLLEARIPEPSLTAASGPGIGRGLAHWGEDMLFWLTVQIVCGSDFASSEDAKFNADREKMLPGFYDVPAMKAALPANVALLHGHLDLLARQLADGRRFLFGDVVDVADISLWFPLEFMRYCRNGNEHIPDQYPAIAAWMGRIAAIGHGRREEISRADALAIARETTPMSTLSSTIDFGPQPGEQVRVVWKAYSPTDLVGELVEAHPRTLAVRWSAPEVGEVVVHFPRTAGTVTPA